MGNEIIFEVTVIIMDNDLMIGYPRE